MDFLTLALAAIFLLIAGAIFLVRRFSHRPRFPIGYVQLVIVSARYSKAISDMLRAADIPFVCLPKHRTRSAMIIKIQESGSSIEFYVPEQNLQVCKELLKTIAS